jgi:glycosyltransferase involved in cell wall biosynthesis
MAPDLVHVHWIGEGFVRPDNLGRLGAPLVWTLHDSWAFTGGCHLPGACRRFEDACGKCPALASDRRHDLSRRGWERRERAWRDLSLTFVAPSRWMADRVRASGLGRDRRVEVIPNGIDPTVYRPLPRRLARSVLGLPADAVVVLLSAHAVGADPNKGVPMLLSALAILADRVPRLHLAVAGSSGGIETPPIPVRYLGPLSDDYAMVLAYAAADVVAIPSREENLPNAAMEAMACGRPVAAFKVGGLPEIVRDGATGALAEPQDPGDLARAIAWIVEDRPRWSRLSDAARTAAVEEYSAERIAKRHAALYGEILARRAGGSRAVAP